MATTTDALAGAEEVRRRVTEILALHGFRRTKPAFWTRPLAHAVEFVHLHLFRHSPAFRAHLGIRVLNDPFEAPALNGPYTDETWRRYDLRFDDSGATVARCADALLRYYREVGEPWFARWADEAALLARGSPLDAGAQAGLRAALAGSPNAADVERSRNLLGCRSSSR